MSDAGMGDGVMGRIKVVVIKSQKFIYMKRNPHEMNPLKEISNKNIKVHPLGRQPNDLPPFLLCWFFKNEECSLRHRVMLRKRVQKELRRLCSKKRS